MSNTAKLQLGFSPLSKTIMLAKMRDVEGGRLRVGNDRGRDVTNEAAQLVWQLVMAEGGEIGWELDDGSRMILKAEKRIAELEARKFKVEMPESFYPDGDIDAPLVVDELEVIAAIVDAGGKPVAFCKRCDREIDLTHRPDGSHYCHAPAVGIGVKGE